MAIDEGVGVPARRGVQRYGRILDLEGASRGGLEREDTARSKERCASSVAGIKQMKSRVGDEKEKKPLDYIERAERTVLWRETVEWGVECDADVVYFLSEDGWDVAERDRGGAGEGSVLLHGDMIGNGVDESSSGHRSSSRRACVPRCQ